MAVLRIKEFSGQVPALGTRALPDTFAADSMNTWLYGNELRGVRPPVDLIGVNPGIRKVLRIPLRAPDAPPPSDIHSGSWVSFQDPDTDIVKGQLIEDQFERWYFCSPSKGPLFNTYERMLSGGEPYKLGVPGPDTSATSTYTPTIVSITGGAEPRVDRSYLYTWVNEFGEESTPTLAVLGAGNGNGVWTIGNILDPPPVDDYPAYKKKYLYRTITGASGQATFYRVSEVALGTTTFVDDGSQAIYQDTNVTNNLQLESTSWAPPPSDPVLGPCLRGWIAMPNGFLIGFDKNNIYMSEAYHWHAWPAEYKQSTETPIVGLGILGQTCVVCTEGYPTTVTGSQPATCSFTKATTGEPCLARGSIVSTPQGVIYASQNGLVSVGPAGIMNITEQLITRDDWLKTFQPKYIRAVRYQNGYLALQLIPGGHRGFQLDPTALKVALTEFTDFAPIENFNVDVWSGEVLALKEGSILHWDPPTNDLMPVRWLSKEFQYGWQANFGCYAIYWDDARLPNPPVNWGNNVIPQDQKVRFRVYADRRVVYDQEVPLNGRGVRLPSGFKADIWQFEIRARAPVYSMHVASTMRELKGA